MEQTQKHKNQLSKWRKKWSKLKKMEQQFKYYLDQIGAKPQNYSNLAWVKIQKMYQTCIQSPNVGNKIQVKVHF